MADSGVDINDLYQLAGYAKTISSRSQSLGRSASELDSRLDGLDSRLVGDRKRLIMQVRELKEEAEALARGVRDVQKALIMMISQMKSAVKRDDFERFEKKVDLWGPERLVNRREIGKVIRDS